MGWERRLIRLMTRVSIVPKLLAVASLVLTAAASPPRVDGAELDPGVLHRAEAAAVQIGVPAPVARRGTDGVEGYVSVATGSGTIVSPDGLILTNYHVVDSQRIGENIGLPVVVDKYGVAFTVDDGPPQLRYWADLVAAWPEADLAVLRISAEWATIAPVDASGLDLPHLPLGDSDAVERGDEVHVFGYPALAGNTLQYTRGTISGFEVDAETGARVWLRTGATVSSGNSGGTAVDGAGELIGVPTRAGTLRCQPQDANGDGAPDACVPFGGTLNLLRPANLAKPLIDRARSELPPGAGQATPVETGN